jgi:hypothetical protein
MMLITNGLWKLIELIIEKIDLDMILCIEYKDVIILP